MFTFASLFGSILFGAIGMAALGYGKKAGAVNPMLIGAALLVFPYFVTNTWLLYAVGVTLTAAIFKFPD